MSKKLYFLDNNRDQELCHPLSYFREEMKEQGLTELTLRKAKPDFGVDFFWCKAFDECCHDSFEICGKQCDDYQPRNGKNGRCRFHTNTYSPGDETITLKSK